MDSLLCLETMPEEPRSTPLDKPMRTEEVQRIKTGLRLHDVAPLIFPEHDLLRQLKKERDALLRRVWIDNGPAMLLHEILMCKKNSSLCVCSTCYVQGESHSCKVWNRLVYYMHQTNVSYAYPSELDENAFIVGPANHSSTRSVSRVVPHRFMLPNAYWTFSPTPKTFKEEENFDAQTACKYISPVSSIDVHIVFAKRGDAFQFVYGRKLWKHADLNSMYVELAKLDFLRHRLRTSKYF